MAVSLVSRARHHARNAGKEAPVTNPIALRAREDFETFCEYLGYTMADIHRSWIPYLVTGQDSQALNKIAGQNLSLLSFRGSAKTTYLRLFAAWVIGHNPHIRIGWISYSESVALKSSRIIKRIIEQPRYQDVFPWIRPGKRWADTDWEIDKGHAGVSSLDADFTFVALGITGSIVSSRFELAVYDDLIKSSAAIANPDVRDKMATNYGEAIEPCLEAIPGSRQICLGTRFRDDDMLATEFTRDNGWQVVEQGVIVTDEYGIERSAWPERINLERMLQIRERRPVLFARQWMNQLVGAGEDWPVAIADIRYGSPPPLTQLHSFTVGIDLAAGEKEIDDFTAFVVAARDYEGRVWVLQADEFREAGNTPKIKRLMEIRKRYGGLRVVPERVAYQASFEGDLRLYLRRYKIEGISIAPAIPRGDKLARLEGISGAFQDGVVWFARGISQRLVSQVIGSYREHDDLMDALIYAVSTLQRRERRSLSSA